jgi:hypothetical protein
VGTRCTVADWAQNPNHYRAHLLQTCPVFVPTTCPPTSAQPCPTPRWRTCLRPRWGTVVPQQEDRRASWTTRRTSSALGRLPIRLTFSHRWLKLITFGARKYSLNESFTTNFRVMLDAAAVHDDQVDGTPEYVVLARYFIFSRGLQASEGMAQLRRPGSNLPGYPHVHRHAWYTSCGDQGTYHRFWTGSSLTSTKLQAVRGRLISTVAHECRDVCRLVKLGPDVEIPSEKSSRGPANDACLRLLADPMLDLSDIA